MVALSGSFLANAVRAMIPKVLFGSSQVKRWALMAADDGGRHLTLGEQS